MSTEGPLLELSGEAAPAPAARRQAEAQLVDKLCAWIDLHLHEDLHWERLMRVSGLPATRLQEVFQRHARTTPMMYIRARRLERTAAP